jgi:hypothetical protein
MARLNEKGINAVKKAVVTAATGPVGSTFGQPMFEGEKMPMGGKIKEVEITRAPQTKPAKYTLPTIINIGGDRPVAYELDDLVAQGKVIVDRYGENSPMHKLYKNLISEKGATLSTKFDQRKNPASSVDTTQTNLGIYSPYKSGKIRNSDYKGMTEDEIGVRRNKKGEIIDSSLRYYGMGDAPQGQLISELKQFLQSRGVKRARSLKIEQGTKEGLGYFENKPEK